MAQTIEAHDASLRAARGNDLPAIERLLLSSGLPTAGVADSLGGFVVAESEPDKRIVGVVGLEHCGDAYALLRSAAVEPEWRGTGLGRRLVTHAIAEAESRGIKALYLLTTTAERYFPSFGFATTTRDAVPDEVKQSVEFREACPASATVMALELT
ncbi:MAG TPA: arsenic resistance N-acetyltransferase ArsN2 [Gemmatimonadaceae bacterium]|nr:arsenic resistance N-acetyltransferase ArsN2 [Gemmatimonadaceae bacterium]